MELLRGGHVSNATLLRCLLISSPALLLSAFVLLQVLLPNAASAWFGGAPGGGSYYVVPVPRSCSPEWRRKVEAECAVDLIQAERGTSLLHSWGDAELLVRAGATIASYKELTAAAGEDGGGGRNPVDPAAAVVRQEMEGGVSVSQFFLQYQQSAHKEYCKLYGGLGSGQAQSASPDHQQGPDQEQQHLLQQDAPAGFLVRPRIAFLFLTTGWLPFARLWDAFLSGNEHLFNVYVHAWPYPGANQIGRDATKHFWGRLVPSDAAQRGTPSLIVVARRLLANALLDDPMNEYFALISDHCVPVRGFRHVYSVLTSSGGKSFVEQLDKDVKLWSRYIVRGGPGVMLPEVEFSKFRVGSQFWVLTRRHALLFVRDTKYWNKFKLPCTDVWSCFPEEHYFPTVLAIEDPDGTVKHTLTAVDWSRSQGAHPRTYAKEEVTRELVASLQRDRGGINLFARKFSDDSIDALMALSHVLLRN